MRDHICTSFTDWESGLQHYGVLGMKWGMRRFQNSDGSLTAAGQKHYAKTGEYGFHYKSHATKKYTRKAARAERKGKLEKAAKFKNRAKRSAEVDRGEQEYAKKLSTGKAVALSLIGSNSLKGYSQYRAMAGQKGRSMSGQKLMAGLKAYRKGSYGSRLAKAAYIRQDENKNTVGAKAARINNKITNAGAKLIDSAAKYAGGWKDRDAAYEARKNKKRK